MLGVGLSVKPACNFACCFCEAQISAWLQGGQEVFPFASDKPVDGVFELAGTSLHCAVVRAWNTAVDFGDHESWEYWEPPDERPPPHAAPNLQFPFE